MRRGNRRRVQPPYTENRTYGGVGGHRGAIPYARPDHGKPGNAVTPGAGAFAFQQLRGSFLGPPAGLLATQRRRSGLPGSGGSFPARTLIKMRLECVRAGGRGLGVSGHCRGGERQQLALMSAEDPGYANQELHQPNRDRGDFDRLSSGGLSTG